MPFHLSILKRSTQSKYIFVVFLHPSKLTTHHVNSMNIFPNQMSTIVVALRTTYLPERVTTEPEGDIHGSEWVYAVNVRNRSYK